MSVYLFLLAAVFSRILPHPWWNFTAVGASLLYFGARRSPRQYILPVLVLAATDYYLTAFVYSYPFHLRDYVVAWAWALGACFLGRVLLSGSVSAGRIVGAALASSTSFFLLTNFSVWMGFGMYPHTLSGLTACYIAGLPFYRNDVLSTTLLTAAVFGIPLLAQRIAQSLREGGSSAIAG